MRGDIFPPLHLLFCIEPNAAGHNRLMKKWLSLLKRYAAYAALLCCFVCTLLIIRTGNSPAPAAAPVPARFVGEALFLRPYLPDEPVCMPAMGIWQTHAALDIACEEIAAPESGTVLAIWREQAWGLCASVQTGAGVLTLRSLGGVCVRAGDALQKGDIIATAGFCPAETEFGKHVHIEYAFDGRACDPTALFSAK